MDSIKKKVAEEIKRGWMGPNEKCSYYPSHFKGQDCTFCYCPFYPCNDDGFGRMLKGKRGSEIWDCSFCLFIHRREVGKFIMSEIERMNITETNDPRMKNIFSEAKAKFNKNGKAVMIAGATSDAGKSVAVAAICRILHKKGYLVSPFKSQNMSLNSKVTRNGHEISMIQTLQSKAAGLKDPDHHMNPILLKPKGDAVSQVIAEGIPYGDYDSKDYYDKFVPGPGTDIVRKSIEFLKGRYDIVVMEGAGSPAEINIYDKDIANMGAAKIAGAPCILIVNVEWGGSFAYAAGTVGLIPEEDRRSIKGIIFNNIRGDVSGIASRVKELEKIINIPVIGMIPHIDLELPSEDSEALRDKNSKGSGRMKISVIRLPRMANFTDIDPLCTEDVTVRFVTEPDELEDTGAIIIPGTKNTVSDLEWMKRKGLDKAVISMKGKVPILGICGGYRMMGTSLEDTDYGHPGTFEGLGLFDNVTRREEIRKAVLCEGVFLVNNEPVTGYEIYTGITEIKEKPLFGIERLFGVKEKEGSFREDEMLFGTHLHGVFEKPSFRRYFLSFVKDGKKILSLSEPKDYDSITEENIEKLAAAFEDNMDIDELIRITEAGR